MKRMLQKSNPMVTLVCDEECCLPCRLAKEMVATAAAVVSTTSWSASFAHQAREASMLVKRPATCTQEELNTKTAMLQGMLSRPCSSTRSRSTVACLEITLQRLLVQQVTA